jgi:hypothetical protein
MGKKSTSLLFSLLFLNLFDIAVLLPFQTWCTLQFFFVFLFIFKLNYRNAGFGENLSPSPTPALSLAD